MGRYCLFAVAGAFALNWCRHLPPDWLLLAVAFLSIACMAFARLRPGGFLLLGFLLAGLAARVVIDDRLAPDRAGRTLAITARVADFPTNNGQVLKMLVRTDGSGGIPSRLRLSWYAPAEVPQLGETWAFSVRLRRPRGFANPGGFDYEGWLYRQGIGATGYVVSGGDNQRLDAGGTAPVATVRRHFVARLQSLLPQDAATAVLGAITVGARQDISHADWDRYAVTGTSHLMAISGMHVGLAAGGVFLVAWAALALVRPQANLRDPALIAAVIAAGLYAGVSGFAVPARRALLMLALAAAAILARRTLPVMKLVAICALAVLVIDPLSIQSPGYKLSFAAVLLLVWSNEQTAASRSVSDIRMVNSIWRGLCQLGKLQLNLLFGLFPLTAMLFDRAAWLGPPVNLLVLPIFNFLALPASLLGMLLEGPLQFAGDALLRLAHASVRAVLWVVNGAAALPFARIEISAMNGPVLLLAVLPAMHAILPPGWPGRRLAWVALLAAVMYRPDSPPTGCVDLHILDVGQGLSVVLRAGGKTLVYDTGPAFRSGSSTAELVLVPFLKRLGIAHADVLVVSHGDLDHAGGVGPLLRAIPTARLLVGESMPDLAWPQRPCSAMPAWRWGGVAFRMLHPVRADRWQGNNASCVLQIDAGTKRILLTGDIERQVENLLLRQRRLGRVTTLVVPHHGSKTSSGAAFVRQLAPGVAVVSAGYGNRWGLPKEEIAARWRQVGAVLLNTAESGAVSQRLCSGAAAGPVYEERHRSRKYWHE